MVVVAHALVAPPWSNGRSMVISSLLNEHFHEFGLCQFFLGSVHDMWKPGHPGCFSGIPMVSRETSHIDKSKPPVMLTPPLKLGGTIPWY